jgi:hypothetical protein
VEITLELLEDMSELTIAAAASRLRVSTTSLKKACRKLGVDRWPYRLEPAVAAPPPPAPVDFDEAYVRRLHRKYNSTSAIRRRRSDPAAPASHRRQRAANLPPAPADRPFSGGGLLSSQDRNLPSCSSPSSSSSSPCGCSEGELELGPAAESWTGGLPAGHRSPLHHPAASSPPFSPFPDPDGAPGPAACNGGGEVWGGWGLGSRQASAEELLLDMP